MISGGGPKEGLGGNVPHPKSFNVRKSSAHSCDGNLLPREYSLTCRITAYTLTKYCDNYCIAGFHSFFDFSTFEMTSF